MGLRRTLARLAALAALALCVAAAADGYRLWQAVRIERLIRAEGDAAAHAASPEAQFVRAHRLAQRGELRSALAAYQAVVSSDAPALRLEALYNSGNLYLREALRLRAEAAELQAVPLLELAKRSYREALREAPQLWDARYNLERALRLAPEGGDEERFESAPAPQQSERAATTMRGFTLGLP